MPTPTHILEGVVVPLVTPMGEPGRPDAALGSAQLEALAAAGVTTLMLLGSNGEGALIEDAEVGPYVADVVRAWDGAVPGGRILANVSAPGTRAMRARASAAAEAGADALTVSAPSYFQHRADEILAHIRAATEVGLPVVVYDIPRSANELTDDVVRGLVATEGIIGIKDSSGDLDHLMRSIALAAEREDFQVTQGSETQLVAGLDAGAIGILPGTGNFAPKPAIDLYAAWRSGNHDRAEKLQRVTTALAAVHRIRPGVPTVKRILADRLLCPPVVAPPLIECTEEEQADLEGLLATYAEYLIA